LRSGRQHAENVSGIVAVFPDPRIHTVSQFGNEKEGVRRIGNWRIILRLLCYLPERQHNLVGQFVEQLRQSSIDRAESAKDSFVTGKMFEPRTCGGEIANGEEEE